MLRITRVKPTFMGNPDDPVVKQVYDYFEYLVRDFSRTMEFYNNRSGESVERVYIMGGGSTCRFAQAFSRTIFH